MEYSFEAINDLQKIDYTGKLMDILDLSPQYVEETTKLHGKVLALFGEPPHSTKSLEDVYCYVICAKDKDGNEEYFSVYEGSSGPAIGGTGSDEVALELKEKILNAQPVDYDYEGYYFDGPTLVKRGVKNGEAYCSEEEISFDECEEAYKEIYG